MKLKTGVSRIAVVRYFSAKLLYDRLGLEEYSVMQNLLYELILRCDSDKDFAVKWKDFLYFQQGIVEKIESSAKHRGFIGFPVRISQQRFSSKALEIHGFPHAREYYGMKNDPLFRDPYSFRIYISRPPRPRAKDPGKFVAVGYKDKGQMRNLAHDGSPKWQDVAGRLSEPRDEKSSIDLPPNSPSED